MDVSLLLLSLYTPTNQLLTMITQEVKEATPRKGVMIAGTFAPKMSADWAFYQLGVAQSIIEALVDEGSYKTHKANKVRMKKRAIEFLAEIRSES